MYKYLPLLKKYFKFEKIKRKDKYERIKLHKKILQNKVNRSENIKYLSEIIEKCQKKKVEIILVTPPFMKEYNKYFENNELKEEFYIIIDYFITNYKIKYIDLSHEYSLFSERDDFMPEDYDHLSEKGSRKFIEELEKRLGISLK